MPNLIALLALAIFPLVVIALYGRLSASRALIASLVVGYLFLPEPPAAFDLPLIPPLSKHNIPALAAFAVALWRYGHDGTLLPDSWVGKALVVIFVFSPIMTVFTNDEAVFFGLIGLPSLALKDGIALIVQQFLLLLPFLLARQFLSDGGAQRDLLKALMIGGLVYSLLMLIEIRLSPQLNNWIYGYYQHLFHQAVRANGFRPVVFLYHGLWVAFFCMTAIVATVALWRAAPKDKKMRLLLAATYLFIVLILAKSLGALLFTLFLVPLVALLSTKAQLRVALVLGLLTITYPVLKNAQMIPEEQMLSAAATIDPERANSLRFRFDNEARLLDRAYEKPFFGWGSWGRNQILDPVSGRNTAITDGRWIIVIGVYGWLGFLAEFGLLVLPLFLIWRESSLPRAKPVSPYVGPLALILAINTVDLLPNATLTPLTFIIAGALVGYAEALRRERLQIKKFETVLKWKPVL